MCGDHRGTGFPADFPITTKTHNQTIRRNADMASDLPDLSKTDRNLWNAIVGEAMAYLPVFGFPDRDSERFEHSEYCSY